MPYKRADGTTQYSLKLPSTLIDKVEEFADERKWSRSQAINHLIEVGIEDGYVEIDRYIDENVTEDPVSVGTKNEEMIETAQQIANEQFDGSFNAAARWAITKALGDINDD